MTFKEYQKKSRKTAIYPNAGRNFVYPTLGLAGEAGEVANKIKKIMRDDNNQITPLKKEELKDELGDVLWYVAQLATEAGLNLDEIAENNIEKLMSRHKRSRLSGSGDNR